MPEQTQRWISELRGGEGNLRQINVTVHSDSELAHIDRSNGGGWMEVFGPGGDRYAGKIRAIGINVHNMPNQ